MIDVQNSQPRSAELRRIALTAQDLEISLVPPREDGSKAPAREWKVYQRQRPSRYQIEKWYGRSTGVGVVCGRVSGNLECLEFDDEAVYDSFKDLAGKIGLGSLVERIEAGYLERSPSPGIHWFYRCSQIAGNTKLARRSKTPEEMRDP